MQNKNKLLPKEKYKLRFVDLSEYFIQPDLKIFANLFANKKVVSPFKRRHHYNFD